MPTLGPSARDVSPTPAPRCRGAAGSVARGRDHPEHPGPLRRRRVAPPVRGPAVEGRGVAGPEVVALGAQVEVELALEHQHALLVARMAVQALAAALPGLDQRL